MTWKPIVAGVDGAPESVRAAVAAERIARRAGTTCTLVRAVPDYERILLSYGMVPDLAEVAHNAVERERRDTEASLSTHVTRTLLGALEVRVGRAPVVLRDAAARHGAGLIVVGGKRHHGLDRLRGSTVSHLVRTADVPVLVTTDGDLDIARVLVALDLSYASAQTLEQARRWVELFGAQLRAIHVIEPMLLLPDLPASFSEEYYQGDAQLRETGLWASIAPGDKVVRSGHAPDAISSEATRWRANLLVIGSHGRGWVERLLLGSAAEHIVARPPAATLVVPVGARAEVRPLEVGALPWEERSAVAGLVPATGS